ncbi:type I DNA topoisomerase [Thalassospiraceae bacterium LMO-SO8]|nr:type I DNA topoisomerase [Alphaproteobacteria bacterium LMO-S08]WND76384.1 type I DNA topoisomerase [Thalassospiraceae bacterium LMO-SO8]
MTDVVVVESPAKAKTINKYLGPGYTVLASYGHIRDLPSKDGSVRPDADFEMDWEIDARSEKHIKAIADAVKGADKLYLATDPDREGEAISWHVREVLNKNDALKDVDVKRVVFNEITKDAVKAAFDHPRELDRELVDAYLARRALDYLVGFTLSPVLWRKLPGSRSAGRVQSVALRLICEREAEIEIFRRQEFWSIKATFAAEGGHKIAAQLTHLNGQKLGKMDLGSQAEAERAKQTVESGTFSVADVQRKQSRRNPAPPFTTSTLQQEAARKLYFGAKRTMQVAQRLYEGVNIGGETVGLITYMRTDGVTMANEAVNACRDLIKGSYGAPYLPGEPRIYKTKAKNAQEAHEAVRPTDVSRRPEDVAQYLDEDQRKLYDLIWKRTVASQMENAVLDQVAVDIAAADGSSALRATGSVIAFDGFLKVYQEGKDEDASADGDDDDKLRILPDVRQGQHLARQEVDADQHFTQPPPRYTEASLVKRLEELGIGRPSTYASIISVLQDRNYVKLESRRFMPEDRGRLVTAFLSSFFERYVEYGFTAELEDRLDDISGGRREWKQVLRDFWEAFSKAVDGTKELRVREVLDTLDELLGPHFFPMGEDGRDPRKCPVCADGRMGLKLGKFGAFIGCSNYPECKHTQALAVPNGENGEGAEAAAEIFPRLLGNDPDTGLPITVRKGPYGAYVQLGDAEEGGPKPKRASLPKGVSAATIDLEMALGLLALPREVGLHPETGDMITAGLGRFGPFLKMGGTYVSLKGDDDVLTVGLNRAVVLFADKPRKDPPKELGKHPTDGKPVVQKAGRWGPFVQHGKVMASLPKDMDKDSVTLEKALELLAAKSGKAAPAAKKAAPKKKAAAKKKTAAKKPAAKKKTAKKTPADGDTPPPASDV